MCFDIGIVTCGPNEALVVSGMGYGEINPDTKEYRPFVVMGRQLLIAQTNVGQSEKHNFSITFTFIHILYRRWPGNCVPLLANYSEDHTQHNDP